MTNQLKNITDLLEELTPLAKEMEKRKTEATDIGFNVFQLASDTYYRENFHSYILYNLINPEYHEEGKLFLDLFIDCLNECGPAKIEKNDFQNPIVERESDRVDVRIRDKVTGKSILIENKINDAHDQYRQIPRYYTIEKDAGYKVSSIVYLTFFEGKFVSTSDWSSKEKKEILPKVTYLPAVSSKKENLIDQWLERCIALSKHQDIPAILRQYKNIIIFLSRQQMDKNLMEEFYCKTQVTDNFQTAIQIREMLANLCVHRANKILDRFRKDASAFNRASVFPHKGEYRAKFQDSELPGINLWIDVVCVETETRVVFTDAGWNEDETLGHFIQRIKEGENLFSEDRNQYVKTFNYPSEESQLYTYLGQLFKKLAQVNQEETAPKI